MRVGDKVRLVSMKEIEAAAEKYAVPPGNVLLPSVRLGDVGTVHCAAGDGLFEVAFERASIVCNDAMVEVIDGSSADR